MGENGNKQGGLSPKACILMAIGGMVGSAIFTLSGVTYGMAGASAIFTWIIAGGVLLLYSLNVSELATTFPESGGVYVYPHEVIGKTERMKDFAGWAAAWSWLNSTVFGTAFAAICVSTYLKEFVPAVKNSVAMQRIIPLVWIFIVWWLNAKSINAMGKIHNKLTLCLVFILGFYVILGLINGDNANLQPFVGGTMGGMGIAAGVPIAMLSYGSIIAVASFAGEIQNPKKNIPRIMATAVSLTLLMFSLILLATFRMAPVQDFLTDPGRQYYPLSYALSKALSGKYAWVVSIVPLGALLALMTNMSILVLDASRTVRAVARSGFLPKIFTKLHPQRQTPVPALTLVCGVAAVLTLKPDLIQVLINMGSICSAVAVTIIAVTLIVLRIKQKKGSITKKGAFCVPGGMIFPVATLLIVLTTLVLLYFGDGGAASYIMAAGWYVIGLIIFGVKCVIKDKVS